MRYRKSRPHHQRTAAYIDGLLKDGKASAGRIFA
jgi:hypothetical protein